MCPHDTPRCIEDCSRSEWTKLSQVASIGIPEFESIGICRNFVRKTVLDAMYARVLDTKERNDGIVPDHGRWGEGRGGGREGDDTGEGELHFY